MHLQQTQSAGPAVATNEEQSKQFSMKSSSLPFGQDISLSSISGPTYLTAQTLIQHVAYTLSDKIFSYSPETFDLDHAARYWQSHSEKNAHGYTTGVSPMETRMGAGSIALGYVFSKDFDLKKRHIPQSIIASSATLQFLRPALDQLSLLYSVASPLVAHVASVDYSAGSSSGLLSDYSTSLSLADELGLGLVSSASVFEVQHMSLYGTLLASVVPTIHTYDGINVGRETTRIVDVLDQGGLNRTYQTILKSAEGVDKKHSDNEGRSLKLLDALNEELGTEYKLFEYHGDPNAESVLVVFGTVEASLASQVATSMSKQGVSVGIINVRVYRPFVEEAFLEALPKTAKRVSVLGQVKDELAVQDEDEHSRLYSDVLAALNFNPERASTAVVDHKYSRERMWTPAAMYEALQSVSNKKEGLTHRSVLDSDVRQYTFWDSSESLANLAPVALGQFFSKDSATNVSLRVGQDNLVQGGVVRSDLRTSSRSIEAAYSIDEANVAYVGMTQLLGEFDVINSLKAGGALIVNIPGYKEEDLEKKIPVGARKGIFGKNAQLYVFDASASEVIAESKELEKLSTQVAFLQAVQSDSLSANYNKLADINGSSEQIDMARAELEKTLRKIDVPESWATVEPEVEHVALPTDIAVNSFDSFQSVEPEPPTLLKDWQTAAKGLAFKEAYGTQSALKPELGVKTHIVRVKERKRLTPRNYDRNIFHIEFDLGDSGMTYAIGEALGVHAENDREEVEEFIKWYGLDPNEIVEVPSRDDADVLENRTVYQALKQNIDIFGRPPKRFYEALSEFADGEVEKKTLLALATAEGAQDFKKRAEIDMITYADILVEFPSAHPSFNDIVRIVSPLKRREYSIASSQRVTPKSVSLLIVTVGWTDPKKRDRFGLATRYLNSLNVGDEVTVSVKPSVMKLPTKTTAPIIMAGLGTGLAPFRAFVQERALQKQEGHDIGAVMLYMGARHQREEYLYGEEWEAYQDAGIITLLGRAFSRDQPQKIYIQDRMRQTLQEIRQAYIKEEGSFYLCGPTWPVPDVTAVLQEAIEVDGKAEGKKKVDSRREIETLKDAGRYVLEVY